jgi:hypothetical protein
MFEGSNPAEDDVFLKAIKILSTAFFGGGVQPSAHVVRLYVTLKIPANMKEILHGQNSRKFLTKCLLYGY